MPIRQQIVEQESIAQFEEAAKEHFNAGFILLAAGSVVGVDDMGLAAEMLLKAAYFRYAGFPKLLTITDDDRDAAKRLARNNGVVIPPQPYHDLKFWAEAIINIRNSGFIPRLHSSGIQFPAVPPESTNEADLRGYVNVLHDNWYIGDRYLARQDLVTQDDMNNVFEAFMGIDNMYQSGTL